MEILISFITFLYVVISCYVVILYFAKELFNTGLRFEEEVTLKNKLITFTICVLFFPGTIVVAGFWFTAYSTRMLRGG